MEKHHFFYLKVFLLVIFLVALLYVVQHKPQDTVIVTRETQEGEKVVGVIQVEETSNIVEEPIELTITTPSNESAIQVKQSNDSLSEEEPRTITVEPSQPEVVQPIQPTVEDETQRLIQQYAIPSSLQENVKQIEEIGPGILHIEVLSGDTQNTHYTYIPATRKLTQIEAGTFKVVHDAKTYYFVNKKYYPFEKYQIYRIENEKGELLSENVEYREKNQFEKITYICSLTDTSFLALVGSPDNYEKAKLYFFDADIINVKFITISEEEAIDLREGTECIS